MDEKEKIERCNSAPILIDEFENAIPEHITTRARLRRHSSLNRGLLHNVRKISESDERHGEAKVHIYRLKQYC